MEGGPLVNLRDTLAPGACQLVTRTPRASSSATIFTEAVRASEAWSRHRAEGPCHAHRPPGLKTNVVFNAGGDEAGGGGGFCSLGCLLKCDIYLQIAYVPVVPTESKLKIVFDSDQWQSLE